MEAAQLAKILSLSLFATCFHVSHTPPTRQQGTPDVAARSFLEKLLRAVTAAVVYWKSSVWIATVAEIAAIVASAYPSLRISNLILTVPPFEQGGQIRLTTASLLAIPFVVAGTWIRLQCYREMGRNFMFYLAIRKDHALVTTGPYSVVRHPSYTGVVLNVIALFLLHGSEGSWVIESGLLNTTFGRLYMFVFVAYTLTLTFGLLMRMNVEDGVLRDHFGKEWDEWAARVPYSVIPGVL